MTTFVELVVFETDFKTVSSRLYPGLFGENPPKKIVSVAYVVDLSNLIVSPISL